MNHRSFFTLIALVGGALLAGCAAQNDAEGTVEESAQDIVNGQSASQFTEAILINTFGSTCSGALIAPRVVLTAGHCVTNASYSVKAPYANGQTARVTGTWTKYQAMTDHKQLNPSSIDVAVLILDAPIQLAKYPTLAKSPLADGTKVINVGRVRDGRISYSELFFGASVEVEASTLFPDAYDSALIAQSGDSGGPVYVGTGENRKIVAVNSAVDRDHGVQRLARVDLAYAEIQQLIKQNGGSGD